VVISELVWRWLEPGPPRFDLVVTWSLVNVGHTAVAKFILHFIQDSFGGFTFELIEFGVKVLERI
jgi:hypothetical protein